jgi:hypothetical protein
VTYRMVIAVSADVRFAYDNLQLPGAAGHHGSGIEAAAEAVKPEDLARARIGALDFEWQITGNPLALWEMYAEARAAGTEQHSSVRRYLDEWPPS